VLALLGVCLAAVLPYLLTVRDYFVADDFGVVQILSQKPAWYFPRWFVGSWMETVFGVPPQEIRPFPAVSYQLTSLVGASAPVVHHVVNIFIHAVNGVLVLIMARQCARLSEPAAILAAVSFVVLPVQVESVGWITGRVDSLPALFYFASFLAYAQWRITGSNNRTRYLISALLFFAALFSKESTITMVATLFLYDVLIAAPSTDFSWRRLRSYLPSIPFAVLTGLFLLLRYRLFGDLVRESQLPSGAFIAFGSRVGRHIQRIVVGSATSGTPLVWTLLLIIVGLALYFRWMKAKGETRAAAGRVLFFGPVWMLVGLIPTIAAGYESPRHLYLTSAGWALLLGFAFQAAWIRLTNSRWQVAVAVVAAALVAAYLVPLRLALEDVHRAAAISKIAATDLYREASAASPGTLLIVGAPLRSWEWAIPLVARPPFAPEDLTQRVFIVSPWLLHCCRTEWLEDTHRTLRAWAAQPVRQPIVILHWDSSTGRASRLTDAEYPDLQTVVPVLIEEDSEDYLDRLILRLTNLARGPTSVTRAG
jgi:hypothetical protein